MEVLLSQKRRTIRAEVNPLDKCTVVSIYPKKIEDRKITIMPGYFEVPAGSYDHPGILIVGPSSWWREIDEYQPLLEIPISSITIADSIVKDYCNGLLAYNTDSSGPGLYYLSGEVDRKDLKNEKYKPIMDKAAARQKNWYLNLVQLADVLWARTNGNPRAIADDMRLAAQELNIKDKPWMKDFTTIAMINCQYCGALRNPAFPICSSCQRVCDPKLMTELENSMKSLPEKK